MQDAFISYTSDGELVSRIHKVKMKCKTQINILKNVPTTLVIREISIKNTLRLYLSPIRVAKIKQQRMANVREDVGKGEH